MQPVDEPKNERQNRTDQEREVLMLHDDATRQAPQPERAAPSSQGDQSPPGSVRAGFNVRDIPVPKRVKKWVPFQWLRLKSLTASPLATCQCPRAHGK